MENIYQKLQNQLDLLLKESADYENAFIRLECCIKATKGILDQLRAHVLQHGFSKKEDEIYFFKEVKPQFYSQFIYYMALYNWELKKPGAGNDVITTYYRSELIALNRFYERNRSFYEYYRSGSTFLDDRYFLRNVFEVQTHPDDHDFDPIFSTSHDYIISKIKAAELLEVYLENLLGFKKENSAEVTINKNNLKWTGESINLAEIGYGIWLTGQINNGNAGIGEILRFLEDAFQIKIGKPYKRWTEIAQRKRYSPTKHLDDMKDRILQRIEKGLE